MSKLGKALGFSMDMGSGEAGAMDEGDASDELESEPAASVKEKPGGSAEVLAMKQFKRATTPEAMAAALKDFGEACGWTTGEY